MPDFYDRMKRYVTGEPDPQDIALPMSPGGHRDPRLPRPSGLREGLDLARQTISDSKRRAMLSQMKGK